MTLNTTYCLHSMDTLPPEVINQLCNLSEEQISRTDPNELHRLIVIAIQQIEMELIRLGISQDILYDKRFRGSFMFRTSQLNNLTEILTYLSS